MPNRARTTVPLVLSTAVALSAAALMFVPRGDAASAPTPETFSAETEGEVWRVNRLDLDMSGDPAVVDVGVGNVAAQVGSAAAPDRAWSISHNVVATPTPGGHASAASTATETQDTVGITSAAGQAGSIPSTLDYGAATLTARSRWGGDESCLDPAIALTSSKVIGQGAAITPAAIPAGTPPLLPIPLPTTIPTEIPTEPPTGFPTELPSDLPTLDPTLLPTPTVTLPTDVPTTGLPTLPTDIPTSIIPSITLPAAPKANSAAAEGDVSMAAVAPATIEERTFLEPSLEQFRRVAGEVVGKPTNASAPAMTFFGGEAELILTGEARLSAYSNGSGNGSQVSWEPPDMALRVGGEDYAVPTDGTALALPYSENEDVVLSVSAGSLTTAESPTGELAQAAVSALNVIIKNGDTVVLDAELFPMSLKLVAPAGGVDCTPVAPEQVDPGLKLRGKNNGPKPDKLTVDARKLAAGARVTLFKVVDGEQKKVGKPATLNKKGDRVFKVKDKNGKKPTKYVVKLRATDLTTKALAVKKIR